MNINVTLLGQMITFSLLVFFTMKKVWPPIMQAMQERQKRISDGLAAAERGAREQELAEQRAAELLKEAKQQAAEIVNTANKRAVEIEEEGKAKGVSEGERMVEAAKAQIEQHTHRAREQLRGEVVALALQGAQTILEREVDAETHNELLDKLAARL